MVLILIDVFRRHISGWAKAGWVILMIVLPFIGVLVYLIAHGSDMTERRVKDAQASQAQFDEYVRTTAAEQAGGSAGEIEKAKALLDSGAISQQEFDALKAKALA